jgi:hypothetical protein
MKPVYDPLQIDSDDWDRAIEESQRQDLEWSLNSDDWDLPPTGGLKDAIRKDQTTPFERFLGTTLAVTAGILLLPIAIPVYLYMSYLDDKYDITCP